MDNYTVVIHTPRPPKRAHYQAFHKPEPEPEPESKPESESKPKPKPKPSAPLRPSKGGKRR